MYIITVRYVMSSATYRTTSLLHLVWKSNKVPFKINNPLNSVKILNNQISSRILKQLSKFCHIIYCLYGRLRSAISVPPLCMLHTQTCRSMIVSYTYKFGYSKGQCFHPSRHDIPAAILSIFMLSSILILVLFCCLNFISSS